MSRVPNRTSGSLSGIGISGLEAPDVVQLVPAPKVDWAAFSVMMIKLEGLSLKGISSPCSWIGSAWWWGYP